MSIALAERRPCAGLAVVSTFTRLADVARHHYGPLGLLAGSRFDSLARVGRRSMPLLVAHGDRDEIVPFELGEQLFAAAAGGIAWSAGGPSRVIALTLLAGTVFVALGAWWSRLG